MPKVVTIEHLIDGAKLTFGNADSLFNEAVGLGEIKAYSRAFFLHQISIEECSKVEMMGAAATELMVGGELNVKVLEKAFRSHEAKNQNNAYYLKGSKAEMAARRSGDIKAAIDAFRKIQREFHEKSNLAKNSSLYVDFHEGVFSAPAVRVRDLVKFRQLNEKYLSIAHDNVGLLLKCQKEPDKMRDTLKQIGERIESLKVKRPKDPDEAIMTILSELLAEAEQRRA